MTRTDREALIAIRDFPENQEHPELAVEAIQAIAAAQLEGMDWSIVVPREPTEHTKDEDCEGLLDDNGTCAVCHVGSGECPVCGGARYHLAGCSEIPEDEPVTDEERAYGPGKKGRMK